MTGNIVSFISVYLAYGAALLAFSVYIFFRLSTDIATSLEYMCFRLFIVVFQIYVILTNIQTLREFEIIYISEGLYSALCFFIFIFVLVNTFCFYLLTMLRHKAEEKSILKTGVFGLIPIITATTLLLISLFNGIIFTVDSNSHMIRGSQYFLIYLCAFVYLIPILKVSFEKLKAADITNAKREPRALIFLIVFIIIWVSADTALKEITTLPIVIFGVIFHLFISFQQSNIYTDTLTGMNNRRKAELFLSDELKNTSKAAPIYMFMGDINGFKKINDEHGHHEGDHALIIFAEAVKKSATAYNGFAARYGGDEFVWAWRPIKNGDFDPEMVIQDIRHRVAAECAAKHKPYIISLSIGYVICDDPKISVTAYLKEADRKMYADKQGHYRITNR